MAAVVAGSAPISGNSLYVGNLAPEVTESILDDKFRTVGQVTSSKVCRDSVTHRSLTYGYVNFLRPEDAKKALEELNHEELMGKPMRVSYVVRDPTQRRLGTANIHIKNLQKDINEKSLSELMGQFGTVVSLKISMDDKGVSRGYGFVNFTTEAEARNAIETLNNMLLEGQNIQVSAYKSKQERIKQQEQSFVNCFVKNLPPNFSEEQMAEVFGKFGKISRLTVRKNDDGTLKGFGFVEFEDHEAAAKAVAEMDGKVLEEGHAVHIERALSKRERLSKLKTEKGDSQPNNLYVKHLPDDATEQDLRDLFGKHGNITSLRIQKDKQTGRSKGFGFVCFATVEQAGKALNELNGFFWREKPLYVAKFMTRESRNRQIQEQIRQQQMYPPQYPMYGMPGMPLPGMPMPGMTPMYPPGRGNRNFPFPAPPRGPRGPAAYGPPAPGGPYQRPPRVQGGIPYGNPRRQQHNNAPAAVNAANNAPRPEMSASYLASLPAEHQRQVLGERLYSVIAPRQGPKAGKITGMLLEMDVSELLHLLEDEEALKVKEQEALKVLNENESSS